jgi:hypothetical protein
LGWWEDQVGAALRRQQVDLPGVEL